MGWSFRCEILNDGLRKLHGRWAGHLYLGVFGNIVKKEGIDADGEEKLLVFKMGMVCFL